ncbi:MAG TPA: TerC family protein [Cytophagales bacterium]|nr:TerC family protein [Cytophagales bacterium]
MIEHLLTAEGLISLFTLTALEIILGIDNVVFISIIAGKLPQDQQGKGRTLGLILALVARLGLLFSVSWIIGLKEPILTIQNFALSLRDLILMAGGLFLIAKSVTEVHAKLEGAEEHEKEVKATSLKSAIIQIIIIDLVFSFDSILTAVGLVNNLLIIVIAIVISLGVMLAFSKAISDFINKHPTMKLLALSFLIMIGFLLVVEGLHVEVPKGYIYFAMAFALVIEVLNMRLRKKSKPVKLRNEMDYNAEDRIPEKVVKKKK